MTQALLALPRTMGHWSLTTLREKPVTIGTRMVRHGHYVTFQMAEVAVSQQMFGQILVRTARLRAPPVLIQTVVAGRKGTGEVRLGGRKAQVDRDESITGASPGARRGFPS